ncbi:uncharacterized protein METZ01_LOCUS39670, partial [marine metagenome]
VPWIQQGYAEYPCPVAQNQEPSNRTRWPGRYSGDDNKHCPDCKIDHCSHIPVPIRIHTPESHLRTVLGSWHHSLR